MSKIYILWATIRPKMFSDMHNVWMNRADNKDDIYTHVCINDFFTESDINIVKQHLKSDDVVRKIHQTRFGVCQKCYDLSSKLEVDTNDIVVFASDDYCPPYKWDTYLRDKFKDREGGLLINDGYQALDFSNMADPIVGLPIMNYGTLLKLNKIIYHPAYYHLCSDAELFLNLKEMGLLIDERYMDNMIFEHHHWSSGKRQPDINDKGHYDKFGEDKETWGRRRNLPLEERLKIQK